MNGGSSNKYKKPKQRTTATSNPGTSRPRTGRSTNRKWTPEPLCPLLAKDSEWVDTTLQSPIDSPRSSNEISAEEEVLQLVECEDGPQMKPLAIMFPDLLEKDPQTLQGVLNRVMSTTEVTRHLVDLGQKANFTFMKKADRLIPPDKQWMESLTENSNSYSSVNSALLTDNASNAYEEGSAISNHFKEKILKRKKKNLRNTKQPKQEHSSQDVMDTDHHDK